MRKLFLAALALLALAPFSFADAQVGYSRTSTTCGAQTYTSGTNAPNTQTTKGLGCSVDGPAVDAITVSPSDSTVLSGVRGLYVGTTGDVAVKFSGDTTAYTFKTVPAGMILPIAVDHVMSTNTTASNIVALK